MTKPPNTDEPPIIIIDDLPSYRRVALVRDGVLDQLWIDDAADHTPQPGAVFAARVAQIFAGHDRATFELKIDCHAEGHAAEPIMASGRITSDQAKTLKPGQIIPVVVSALPREDKPLQVKIKGDVSPKDLPPQPRLISPSPVALARALAAEPEAAVVHDDTGEPWAGAMTRWNRRWQKPFITPLAQLCILTPRPGRR